MRYLTKQEVVKLNKATVAKHGGNFMPPSNFLHEENLDYLLEAVQAELFGKPMYPTIADKAAVYCYSIIDLKRSMPLVQSTCPSTPLRVTSHHTNFSYYT